MLAVASLISCVDAECDVKNIKCYVDDSDRILGSKNVNSYDAESNEWCAQLCYDAKMPLAGTEDGYQCYCGKQLRHDAKEVDISQCNMPCRGYEAEKCGGSWRISIFNVSCHGTPVPPPPETPKMINPCVNMSSSFSKMPFCDPTLSIEKRVEDAISRMTLAEKINALGTGTNAIHSLGLESYNWWSEATHGISHGRFDKTTPYATNFAFPITTAMSFNRTLWWKTGSQIGREARAFMNAGNGYSTFWAPVINLAREPRWGRNIETPGEDPYLTGEYAAYFVQGFQDAPDDPYHIQASACCKHYVANSMESSTEVGVHHWRNEYDAYVPMQDLIDSYLLPFQVCVEKGRVSGLMCSYNAINGIPACANGWLLNTVARGEWEFDGYITSDCDADADVFNHHHYTATPEETVREVLHAGTDVDCGGFVQSHAQSALDKGVIKEVDIDERLRYLFKVRMRLSHFDPVGPLDRIKTDVLCSDYALALARDGTAQGTTLLKNAKSLLPLDASSIPSVAVIGPNSNLSEAIAGYYGPGPHSCGKKFWNMVDAVAQYVPNTTTAKGVPNVLSDDTSLIPAAVAMAKTVDTVVMAVGTDLSAAREGSDAKRITFSKGQVELINQVADAAKRPIVVVILTAVPLDISVFLNNRKIGAILHVGQPSVTTLGVGDVIFGQKVPAGRTIQTILPGSYADEISIFDMGMRPGPSPFPRPDCNETNASLCPHATNPGRTHRFYTGKTIIPFGFGLSYTTFKYTIIAAPQGPVSLEPVRTMLTHTANAGRIFPTAGFSSKPFVNYSINVTNTGNLDADDVVLGFLVPPNAGKDGIPLQTLFGFDRVHVKAGQTMIVWLYPTLLDFTVVNVDGQRTALAGEYTIRFGVVSTVEHGQGFTEHKVTMF